MVTVLVIVVVEVTVRVLRAEDEEGTMGIRVIEGVMCTAAWDDLDEECDTGERLNERPPSPLAPIKTDDSDFVVVELEDRIARIVVVEAKL